jgi:hypothetical protein
VLLSRFLAPDAVPRPWNGFQPFRFDIAPAFGALSKTPLPHPLLRLGECLEPLLGDSRLVKQHLPVVLARRLIGRISMSRGVGPSFPLGSGKNTLQF